MTRRCFLFVHSLVLPTLLATTSWGQSTSGRMTLAERMAAVRAGRSADTPDNGEAERRSLLPDWFSRDEEQRPAKAAGQSPAEGNIAQQTAPQPRAGSAQPAAASANNAALPGLGGSPLPQGKWTPSRNGAAGRGNAFRELSSDYPVIRDVTAEKSEKSADSRPSASTPISAAEGSSTRHSSGLRPMPHVDPDDLQRELAGAFSPAGNGPAARTARADDIGQPESAPADAPVVLPPVETASPASESAGAEPLRIEQAEPQAAPSRSFSHSAAEAFGATPDSSPSLGTSNFTRTPRLNTAPVDAPTEGRSQPFGEALQVANGGDPTVLLSNQTPTITADIRGPKQIMIGREAVYRVRLQNGGASAAEGVVATVRIPSWADVVDSVATQGTVQPSQNAATPTELEWQLARIEGRATETLDIRLVPRESRPLELSISWTIAPVGSRAIVEVQEPKLNIEVTGPNEVLFAKPQVFKLMFSNPGTGAAENVQIELVPPGGAQESATNHPLGNLQPGETKSVEIELTAREAGKLQIKAIASAEGGLVTEVAKEIFCRKPELEVDWRGPATQYAGTTATYFFRVRNPGTAPAEDVAVQVTLPEGAEFASASEGQAFDAQRRQVSWRVGTLAPGDDNYMELKCVVKKPGTNQFALSAATSTGDLTDTATAETSVIALADLKLEVSDPSGAVVVGSPATYEIRVANRGASAAKDVTVVALFSDGIEPDQAEGAMYTVTDGRVAFRPIDELPAGRDITLRIRARAVAPGTHVFRAEVLCSDAEIKLAAEETTRFYSDEVPAEADNAGKQAATRNGFEAAAR